MFLLCGRRFQRPRFGAQFAQALIELDFFFLMLLFYLGLGRIREKSQNPLTKNWKEVKMRV
jgi:hypothetical protein